MSTLWADRQGSAKVSRDEKGPSFTIAGGTNRKGTRKTDVPRLLQELGFGDYEARAYVALLQRSPVNGHQIAGSRASRAYVYAVPQKLEERGPIVRSTRYSGHTLLHAVQEALDQVARPARHARISTVHRYAPLRQHALALVTATNQWLLLSEAAEGTHERRLPWKSETQRAAQQVSSGMFMRASPATSLDRLTAQRAADAYLTAPANVLRIR